MREKMQLRARGTEDEPRFVVGMDAHAHKLAVSVWDWSDRFNACLTKSPKNPLRKVRVGTRLSPRGGHTLVNSCLGRVGTGIMQNDRNDTLQGIANPNSGNTKQAFKGHGTPLQGTLNISSGDACRRHSPHTPQNRHGHGQRGAYSSLCKQNLTSGKVKVSAYDIFNCRR